MLNNWPNPSWLERFLLENPWPAAAVLLAVGLMLGWYYLQRRAWGSQRGLLIGAAACIAAVGAVVLAAALVTTTREKLMSLNEQLVHAVAPKTDVPKLESLFSPTIEFQVTDSITQSQERQPLMELIDRVMSRFHLRDVALLAGDARGAGAVKGDPPDVAESYFQVRVALDVPDGGGIFSGSNTSVVTDWLVRWQRQPDGSWRIITLRWLKIGNQDPAASMLP